MADFNEDELIQLAFLRDEETDALVESDIISRNDSLSISLDEGFEFCPEEFILMIRTGPSYPLHSVQYDIENQKLPQPCIDALRFELKRVLNTGSEKNTLNRWLKREEEGAYGIFEPHRTVFELVTTAKDHLDRYHETLKKGEIIQLEVLPNRDKHSWFIKDAKQPVEASSLHSVNEVAYKLLGLSPRNIADMIPGGASGFRVLHVEQILRLDIFQKHEAFRSQLQVKLRQCSPQELRRVMPPESRPYRVENMVEHLTKSRITFHGTKRQYVPSIVRHGFVAAGKHNPTTGQKNSVRCGSTYGRGIYSSPDAHFALSYSGEGGRPTSTKEFYGIKLIVCATVMGRPRRMTRDDQWYGEDEAHATADSHVGNGELEYIVFGKAQTIPVYVVHLDWGKDNVDFLNKIPRNRQDWRQTTFVSQSQEQNQVDEIMYPGDKQRVKQAIFAKAAKYFPYGYGPATGSKFLVEEVGEISDDEEEYGEYQALRIDEDESGGASTEFWSWVKIGAQEEHRSLFQGTQASEEYTHERHALGVPQGFKKKADEWDELGDPGEKTIPQEVPQEEDVFGLVDLMKELPEGQ